MAVGFFDWEDAVMSLVLLDHSHDVTQVFFEIERISVRPRPGQDLATDWFVVVEDEFQYSLATSQSPQLLLQLVHSSCWNLTLKRVREIPDCRSSRNSLQACQHPQCRSERVCRTLNVEAVNRLTHDCSGLLKQHS